MKWILLSLIIFLSACDTSTSVAVSPVPGESDISSPTVSVTASPVASGDVERYKIGEPITFLVDEEVYVCNYFYDEIPYSIIQIIETREREIALRHSCTGLIAQGVDEYCEEGSKKTVAVEVGKCSDDVSCGISTVKETFTWDQQEFVDVTEECAGETIHREVKQQVPEGKYKVVVRFQQDDEEIVDSVIKEFMIIK
jgi:hypothetical protein